MRNRNFSSYSEIRTFDRDFQLVVIIYNIVTYCRTAIAYIGKNGRTYRVIFDYCICFITIQRSPINRVSVCIKILPVTETKKKTKKNSLCCKLYRQVDGFRCNIVLCSLLHNLKKSPCILEIGKHVDIRRTIL